ncbi:dienelactone hydrolase family protein [Streptomyces sp. NPDC020801]|uniref:dienelactone hydrolase family protein n=1 Tax=unclassified Streptomyces TaxID=2593676 RepID=UPI003799F6D2
MQDIPLEYFATAAHLLAAQPSTDPARIITMGYSRVSEAALLLAENYPRLIHGAWTYRRKPISQSTIRLDHLSGPLLSIAGADDTLWASPAYAKQIAAQLNDNHDRYPHQSLIYPGAGHGVGTFPYLATATSLFNRTTGRNANLGGSRAADAAARERGWPRVLSLLADARH